MAVEGKNIQEHPSRKYGLTTEECKRTEQNITDLGAELGFEFDFFDEIKIVNTRDAHILLDFAKNHGKRTEVKMRLFNAYFNESKDISDRQTLLHELQQIGLISSEALSRLENAENSEEVKTKEAYWHRSRYIIGTNNSL